MWQVSRVAEFTPCLLQIVLNSVDLSVRQAGESGTSGHMSVPSVDMYIRLLLKSTGTSYEDYCKNYANKAMSPVFM